MSSVDDDLRRALKAMGTAGRGFALEKAIGWHAPTWAGFQSTYGGMPPLKDDVEKVLETAKKFAAFLEGAHE